MTVRLDVDLPSSLVRGPGAAHSAETLGYATGWVPETTSNPFVVSAGALAATTDLRIGTAIAVAFARSPFVTAQTAWDLAAASGGRFRLGLGTQVQGHIERRFSATWSHPADRLREYVLAVRAIWEAFRSGAAPSFEGRFYTHTLLSPAFDPGPHAHPDIDVLLAAVNPGVAEVAGEVADGIVVHPLHSPTYLDDVLLPAVGRGLAKAGRDREGFQLIVPVWAIVGDDEQERAAAAAHVRDRIGFYGATRTYARVFECHGWEDVPARLHAALATGDMAAVSAAVPDEALDVFAVTCRPDQLVDALRGRLEGRAGSCMLYAPLPERVARDALPSIVRAMNG